MYTIGSVQYIGIAHKCDDHDLLYDKYYNFCKYFYKLFVDTGFEMLKSTLIR